ncbi:uroplakin-2 [Hemiscyllium ocellatum]|uniref:uroplakin-2 n=1 Tax=Hemiscyllium ocellatum TaxID=170820 RepID=UPI0029662F0F|nr:uroplakin-2 [Hemiscyllium ocellatum]
MTVLVKAVAGSWDLGVDSRSGDEQFPLNLFALFWGSLLIGWSRAESCWQRFPRLTVWLKQELGDSQCPFTETSQLSLNMKLLILLALSSFTDAGTFNISLANQANNGIVGGVRSLSAIVNLPPCMFSNQQVMVNVTDATGGPGPGQKNFVNPICRFKRGLISIVSDANDVRQTLNLGYQLTNLRPGTEYNVVYRIGNEESNPLSVTTISPMDFNNIDVGFSGRSGAMVVITVLLSVAIAVLIILLIVSVFVRT